MKRIILVMSFILASCTSAHSTSHNAHLHFQSHPLPPRLPSRQPLSRPYPPSRRRRIHIISWSIDYLRSRAYGGGQIEFLEVMAQNLYFTRYLMRYPSDGLNIYGFADIPNDEGPHPVIIALHGYIDPAIYYTLDYTTHYADAIASAGYIVLHPNLRGYPPSDNGDNLFRVGMAIDVLNLIALVQSQSGGTDLLRTAMPDRIGMWGHSMGGGITTRVLTVTDDVRAAVLYGCDERRRTEKL